MHPAVIIGILLGLLFGGWQGAILGAIAVYCISVKLKINEQKKTNNISNELLEILFLALGKIAKSDGVVIDKHIEQARYEIDCLRLNAKQIKFAMLNFNIGKTAVNFAEVLQDFSRRRDIANWLLAACWRMAWCDGTVGLREKQALIYFGQLLNLSVAEVLALGKEYQPNFTYQNNNAKQSLKNEYKHALQLLGITPETERLEVKRIYRKLVSQTHPDKFAKENSVTISKANELTQQLHHAYEVVCKFNGW